MTALDQTAASQVSDATLIDEINRRLKAGNIDADALAIPAVSDDDGVDPEIEPDVDRYALEEAQVRFARRDCPETLFQLEKALGRGFLGLSDLVLGRR